MELEREEDAFSRPDDVPEGKIGRPVSAIDSMNAAQKEKVYKFYEAVAEALPLEGRDYRIDFMTMPGNRVTATVVGLNKLGEAFASHISSLWVSKARKGV